MQVRVAWEALLLAYMRRYGVHATDWLKGLVRCRLAGATVSAQATASVKRIFDHPQRSCDFVMHKVSPTRYHTQQLCI